MISESLVNRNECRNARFAIKSDKFFMHFSTAIHEGLDDLDRQRISIEERKELVKKREKDLLRAQ